MIAPDHTPCHRTGNIPRLSGNNGVIGSAESAPSMPMDTMVFSGAPSPQEVPCTAGKAPLLRPFWDRGSSPDTSERHTTGMVKNAAAATLDQVSKALFEEGSASVLWTREMEGCIDSSGLCAGPDGTIFHGNSDGNLYALDGTSGEVRWKSPIQRGTMYSPPIIGDDGTVYIHSCAGHIYAFDAATGDTKSKVEPSEISGWQMVHTPPVMTGEGVLISSNSKTLGAYDPKTLARIWEYPSTGEMGGIEAGRDGTIYFGNGDEKLVALDAKTGTLKWERPFEHTTRTTPKQADDGSLFVHSFGSMHRINAETGKTEWEAECAGWAVGKPLVDEAGTVYFGDDGGHLRAIDGKTGQQKWEFETASCVITSPVMDRSGSLYVTSYDGRLYCIDSKSGGLKWALDVEGKEDRPRQPVIAKDGTVYLAVDEHHIKAVKSREFMSGDIVNGAGAEPENPEPQVEEFDNYLIIDDVKLEKRMNHAGLRLR